MRRRAQPVARMASSSRPIADIVRDNRTRDQLTMTAINHDYVPADGESSGN